MCTMLLAQVVILTPLCMEEGGAEGERIATALRYNLRSASLCAVLGQGEKEFTDVELFTAIANLSYKGKLGSKDTWIKLCPH